MNKHSVNRMMVTGLVDTEFCSMHETTKIILCHCFYATASCIIHCCM